MTRRPDGLTLSNENSGLAYALARYLARRWQPKRQHAPAPGPGGDTGAAAGRKNPDPA